MDFLWTPWRYHYVTTPGKPDECVFCAAGRSSRDKDHFVVYRAAYSFVILNRFPYTCGHIMVVPYSHVSRLEELEDDALVEIIRLTRECEGHLQSLYEPDGMNIGMNLGKSAGAGIAAHVHMHVLPRWTGDTSFMTSVAETRVLPETLEVTWERLSRAFKK